MRLHGSTATSFDGSSATSTGSVGKSTLTQRHVARAAPVQCKSAGEAAADVARLEKKRAAKKPGEELTEAEERAETKAGLDAIHAAQDALDVSAGAHAGDVAHLVDQICLDVTEITTRRALGYKSA